MAEGLVKQESSIFAFKGLQKPDPGLHRDDEQNQSILRGVLMYLSDVVPVNAGTTSRRLMDLP